jgi:ABC-type multidrug transport system fused ATPase/permease subunit
MTELWLVISLVAGFAGYAFLYLLYRLVWWHVEKLRVKVAPNRKLRNVVLRDKPPFLLQFRDLSVKGRVDRISGDIRGGTLTLILGQSGSGKSSLLGALIGAISCEGEVRINGHLCQLSDHGIRANIGFVPQADVVWRLSSCMFFSFHNVLSRCSRLFRPRKIFAFAQTYD